MKAKLTDFAFTLIWLNSAPNSPPFQRVLFWARVPNKTDKQTRARIKAGKHKDAATTLRK